MYSIGIDIGGTNTVFGLVSEKGVIAAQYMISTKSFSNVFLYIKALFEGIKILIEQCPQQDSIIAIGIGAPNGNAFCGTIEHAPNLPFKGVIEIKKELEELLLQDGFSLKVYLTNDANAAAIGEMIYGKAKKEKNFIMITLGTGVGSGIVVDGKLVYGHDSFAGEVGHTKICDDGRLCGCGRRGCLETYASATGIVKTAEELLAASDTPSLLRALSSDKIEAKTISEAAQKGDAIALQCFDKTAQALAIALANAVAITSPKKIYLFGGLSKAGDLLLTPLRKYFEQELYVVFKGTIDIEFSSLPESDAAILGAAALGFAIGQ